MVFTSVWCSKIGFLEEIFDLLKIPKLENQPIFYIFRAKKAVKTLILHFKLNLIIILGDTINKFYHWNLCKGPKLDESAKMRSKWGKMAIFRPFLDPKSL